jgi:type 1 fimbria pilin
MELKVLADDLSIHIGFAIGMIASDRGRSSRPRKRVGFLLALILVAIAAIWQPAVSSADTTITVNADTPSTGNCNPFGGGGFTLGAEWAPYLAWIYKNIPAFQLNPNDTLAFDTIGVNDTDVQVDVALARATANGSNQAAQPFTTIATNTQTPANPRGDTTQGNFELQFRAQAPFSFPGGGLIIRIGNPSSPYAMDMTCTGDLVGGNATDPSGYFVEREYNDANGVDPWDHTDPVAIGVFRLTLLSQSKPSNVFSFGHVKRKKNKGTATLAVNLPGPGTLSLTGKGVKTQRAGRTAGAVASKAVAGAGTVKLLIKPKGKRKHKLNRAGKVKVKVNVTYIPTGGDPNTESKRVKLIKKP